MAFLLSALAFGCGQSSSNGDEDPNGSGGSADGTGATGTGAIGGDGNLSTGGSGNDSGGNDGGGAGGVDGDGDTSGPCGDRVGTPTIDGYLQATDDMIAATNGAGADFETALASIESELGLDGSGNLNTRVDAIVASLSAEVAANTDGLWIYGAHVECVSDIRAAQEAQLSCEKTLCGGGDGVNAGEIPVECSGACLGACAGACSTQSTQLCMADVDGQTCEGICDGTCELAAPGACDGICVGSCSGTCTETDESGCIGECEGSCEGTCTPRQARTCGGSCTGTCLAEEAGGCSGDTYCDSVCVGECKGACSGTVVPAAGVSPCEHSAHCKPQAGALSLAHLHCTATALRHAFEYTGAAASEAQFTTKIATVVAELQAAEDSFNLLSALITGEVHGEVVYEAPPVAELVTGLQGIVDAGFSTVPEDRLACVVPALEQAVQTLSELTANSSTVLQAQAKLVASGRSGFD